ncbi:ABC transporter permease [Haloarchaeobius amylolyticus]|uniref:ABC transporter permease n=1 Tax=Haloarchaeobius amylolyticus TaxID=1198296 RepID=UPI00226FB057|nr:ABC transporter permease [Haloarchaeobius amylolyticus]
MRRKLLRRGLFAIFSVYLVISVAFGVIALTNDPNVGSVAYGAMTTGGDVNEAIEAYREARNLNDPLVQRWANWIVGISTGDWGISYTTGEPVLDVIGDRAGMTLAYLVPSIVLAAFFGISFGLFAAFRQHTFSDRLVTTVAYLGLGVPNFWLAYILVDAIVNQHSVIGFPYPIQTSELFHLGFTMHWGLLPGPEVTTTQAYFLLPIATLTTALFAGQLRYARAESLEYIDTEFVKIARAKGAGPIRVARHVLRNAAIPLVSLFFTDMLSVLVLSVFVIESVFNIDGLAALMLEAVSARDMPLILGVTMVVAFVGIAGNFVQDLAYTVLDPRVGNDAD